MLFSPIQHCNDIYPTGSLSYFNAILKAVGAAVFGGDSVGKHNIETLDYSRPPTMDFLL